MASHKVESFPDFVEHTINMDLLAETVIYRGQSVRGNLLPAVARANPKFDTTEHEMRALKEIRYLGASLVPPGISNDLDLLVMAQHFGLKTRLLDWTSNALAALYFACSSTDEGDVFVYSLAADGLLADEAVYNTSPFTESKTRVLRPRLNNNRIIAQHGWFTLHRYSLAAKRFVALDKNPDTRARITEFAIPADKRAEIVGSLDRYGVSARTLLPDLQGLCQYLNYLQDSWPRLPLADARAPPSPVG